MDGRKSGVPVEEIFARVLPEFRKLIQHLVIVRMVFEINVSCRMKAGWPVDAACGDAQTFSVFQFIKETRSAVSTESTPGPFGRIKPAQGLLVQPFYLLLPRSGIGRKMTMGFQALAAVTIKHRTQLTLDLKMNTFAKAASAMDFHASSFHSGSKFDGLLPTPSLVCTRGYCYKIGIN